MASVAGVLGAWQSKQEMSGPHWAKFPAVVAVAGDGEFVEAQGEDAGVVGEETNKLMGYLAAVSRKLEQPLAIIVQSSSAAGKSALMEAVLALMRQSGRPGRNFCTVPTTRAMFSSGVAGGTPWPRLKM